MKKYLMVLAVLLAGSVRAQDLVIHSFATDGTITFNAIPNAAEYRLDGGMDGAWSTSVSIPASGSGTVTASVSMLDPSMLYRVSATVANASGFSLIPAGTFLMGSPTDELGRTGIETQHQVTLTQDFLMQKTEVTNRQLADVMNWAREQGKVSVTSATLRNLAGRQQELLDLDDGDCRISWNGSQLVVDTGKDDDPCREVTWYGAQAYCNYLSDLGGLSQAVDFADWSVNIRADGYRLPTESEWEYACRAGTTTAFYTGEITQISTTALDPNLDVAGWYGANSGSVSHVGGLKQANSWGLFDMHGNLYEWCGDWFGEYPGPVTDPAGLTSGVSRVARGGSWSSGPDLCRSACRIGWFPDRSDDDLGFRPVRAVAP